jgi:hypothetical protein
MTTQNLEILPFFCEKVATGDYNRNMLVRLVRQCKPEWNKLRLSRQILHSRWKSLPLRRGSVLNSKVAIDWSDAEVEYLGLALAHLGEWLAHPSEEQLNQARSRLQMADQAHRQYLRCRIKVEPEIVQKLFLSSILKQAKTKVRTRRHSHTI